MARITFVGAGGSVLEAEAEIGQSVMIAAQQAGLDMEGACEGVMACSTCHVVVDAKWFDKLAPPTEEEEFMLDLSYGLQRTSRLACQILMTDALDGLVVTLPNEWRNMMI
ncbi:MAG: 2Fe-2S iron-sulfur cluster binding domain-containing protein [Rhodospirillales bacterium]|nr:2Fe-2S iron-sulfur cluster binding domain-containing protein [Rhodospirillales bacterium]